MAQIGYYNYYGVKYKNNVESVTDYHRVREIAYNKDKLSSNAQDPNAGYSGASRRLQLGLNDYASSLREQFSNEGDLREYLGQKYFGRGMIYTDRWENPQAYAMFENDLHMAMFGVPHNPINDPRSDYSQENWKEYDTRVQKERHDGISSQFAKLMNNLVDIKDSSLLISFNPYDMSDNIKTNVLLDGEQNAKTRAIEQLLSRDTNAKNAFYYTLNLERNNLDNASIAKFRAFESAKNFANVDLRDFRVENGSFISSSGDDLMQLIKDGISKDEKIKNDYKGAAYEYAKQNIDILIAAGGWDNVKDLDLKIAYNTKDGFYLPNINIQT
ncbi:MAG: DUF4885 domain-containing protein [Campylobacter sp.]|nr:DUF4885 domain-containing protein [Campylobacter sp.]